MALHDYKCNRCQGIMSTLTNSGDSAGTCPDPDCRGELRKRYSFNTVAVAPATRFKPHMNTATGKWTNSMAEHRANLQAAGVAASERTGIEHNYVSVDALDKEACGVTGEGHELLGRHRSLARQGLLDKAHLGSADPSGEPPEGGSLASGESA